MKRMHLFEFGDKSWCPRIIRRGITEILATISRVSKLYAPTAEVLNELLSLVPEKRVVALASGSGGGILDILPQLDPKTQVVLTDLFPDQSLQSPNPRVTVVRESVDATRVPRELTGVRVIYGAFHHFNPQLARKVLASAVQERQPIAIFEATERSARGIINPLLSPLVVWALTPFTRPFRWSRLLLTYLVPVMPAVFLWDGLVSTLRTYSPDELKHLTSEFPDYNWRVLTLKGPHQERIPTLVGVPSHRSAEEAAAFKR